MILRELNQPSNFLTSRLGLYNSWRSEFGSAGPALRPTLALLFIHTLIGLIFKNGFIFLVHPFRSGLFFRVSGFYPLPKFFTVEDMYKFYRLHRVKAKIFKTYKTTFILRKVFSKLIFNSVRLFVLGQWTLIVCNALIPTLFKLNPKHSLIGGTQRGGLPRFRGDRGWFNWKTSNYFAAYTLSSFFIRKI